MVGYECSKGDVHLEIVQTAIPGVLVLSPRRFTDERGFFCETWNKKAMLSEGLDFDFVQDNHSFSVDAGTLRGLHLQNPPHAQDKLVRCGRGALFDVAVDVRTNSPTYGQWFGQELSFENGKQMLIPKGCLHGFMTLTRKCEIIYKCSDYYAQNCEAEVAWNDPDIGIQWPEFASVVISEKDKLAGSLADLNSAFRI